MKRILTYIDYKFDLILIETLRIYFYSTIHAVFFNRYYGGDLLLEIYQYTRYDPTCSLYNLFLTIIFAQTFAVASQNIQINYIDLDTPGTL